MPWVVVLINLLAPKGAADATVPGFVYGIVISLFVLFSCFAVSQHKQYRAEGKWADYLRGVRVSIVLSLVASSVRARQVLAGALAT